MFELYNEPHDVSWSVWRSGGTASSGFQAVGMQQLYDAVRATGAQNLVIIGGLDWAYDLSGVPANRIDGYNIAYATHPYNAPGKQPVLWDSAWGFLTETDPIIVTEFGDTETACATDYSAALIQYADAHVTSWTAWAWYPGGCSFPALIDDWSATPSAFGHGRQGRAAQLRRSPGVAARRAGAWPRPELHVRPRNRGMDLECLRQSGPHQSRRAYARRWVSTGAERRGADGGPSAGALELTAAFTGDRPVRDRRYRASRPRA